VRTASEAGFGVPLGISAIGGEVELVFDEVGDDLGVGFGDEDVALGDELALELEVVFDDAVVDDDERAGAVAVGVGVLFGGAAVGGPAGVADAVGAVEGWSARTASRLRSLPGARRISSLSSPLQPTAMRGRRPTAMPAES
jgi:hypothetical protein